MCVLARAALTRPKPRWDHWACPAEHKANSCHGRSVCVAFDQPDTADKVLNALTAMSKEQLIELEDACVVVRPAEGEPQLKQMMPLTKVGALSGGSSGALWGALVGLLFLNPLAGMAIGAGVGAATGALAGSLSDYGINDDFIKDWAARSSRTARPCSC